MHYQSLVLVPPTLQYRYRKGSEIDKANGVQRPEKIITKRWGQQVWVCLLTVLKTVFCFLIWKLFWSDKRLRSVYWWCLHLKSNFCESITKKGLVKCFEFSKNKTWTCLFWENKYGAWPLIYIIKTNKNKIK